jgi:ATP-binding cassette subfamily B protein
MNTKPNINRATLRFFWDTGWLSKRDFLIAMLNPLGTVCTSTLVPLFIGKAIAALVSPTARPEHYLPYIIVSGVVGLVFNRVGFLYLLRYQARTMSHLQAESLRALLRRSVGFHNDNVGGKLVSDAIDYPAAFNQLAGSFFNGIIPLGIIFISGSIVIFFDSWLLGIFISIMAILIIGMGARDSRRRAPVRQRRLGVTKEVTGHLADAILNVQTIKTFARESSELKTNDQLNEKLLNLRLRDWSSAAVAGNNRIALLLLFQVIFVAILIRLVHNDPSLLGVGIFAFSFTITLSARLFEVNVLLRTIEEAFLNASPLTEIMLAEPEIQDKPGAKPLQVKKGALALNDVVFRYQDDPEHEPVFSELNLRVKPGEKIGLVGPSGGGKSTLTRLLLRFEDINAGSITIDEQSIADVTQASLRQAISYVPQEPLLFHRTIKENIAYGHPEASDEEIIRASKMAHAHEFIGQLTEGYDTIVGERGVKLSGGQRQRIAIARAVLKDAPILLLDEATSALDSESEVLIQDALWKLMQRRTAIVIAHRLSTIQKMDRIIVLDNGKITEEGSHHELLKKKGLYAQLWAHQSGGFIEE